MVMPAALTPPVNRPRSTSSWAENGLLADKSPNTRSISEPDLMWRKELERPGAKCKEWKCKLQHRAELGSLALAVMLHSFSIRRRFPGFRGRVTLQHPDRG